MASPSGAAAPGPRLRALAGLTFTVLGLWALYAALVAPHLPAGFAGADLLARLVTWVLPSLVYLVLTYGRDFWVPLGLHFPYGARQVVLALVVPLAVGALLLLGTATRYGVPFAELVDVLASEARPRLVAPVLEELVFRGVLASEALTLARLGARDADDLRRRYWLAQLGAAFAFTLLHVPAWLAEGGGSYALAASFPLLVTGLVLGFVFAQTRCLYAVVALHWLNNELSRLPL
jgi:membrane protease YdiL (CAAX protease family)